jgi:hypothetical protein
MNMKQTFNRHLYLLKYLMISFAMMLAYPAISQDGGLDIDIDVDKKEWYEQPWAWVVGAAIFILLLVAILRGGRKGR